MENPVTIENEVPKIARIGTDNFVDYLVGKRVSNGEVLRGDMDDFEKQIEVPEVMHQAIKEMYEEKREGQAMGPNHRARQAKVASQLEEYIPGITQHLENSSEEMVTAEQVRVVYTDMDTQKIGVTSSTFGYGYEADVTPAFQEATGKNGLPLMIVHTHPKDILFSPEDYSTMMVKVTADNDSARLMNAAIVLLPDGMQLMALATKDTPMLDQGEVQKLLVTENEESQANKMGLLTKSLDLLGQINERKRVIIGVNQIKDVLGPKYADVVDEQAKQFNIQPGELEQLEDMGKQVEREALNSRAKTNNTELVAFAKKIGVKLYFSQDMRTFKEFTA